MNPDLGEGAGEIYKAIQNYTDTAMYLCFKVCFNKFTTMHTALFRVGIEDG